jgi:hypothetical protein
MKYLLIGVPLLCLPLVAELTVDKIDKMVEQIQGKRSSKVDVQFEKVASPFAIVVQSDQNATPIMKTVEQQVSFRLSAIVNDRAMINDRWLASGDTIQGYVVETVEENRVVLKKSNRTVELFLPDPNKSNLLQISEG